MYVILDENNYITTASWGGILENGIEVEDFDLTEDIRAYQYIDGKIMLDEGRLKQLKNKQMTQEEVGELKSFLDRTDFITLQWLEEKEISQSHHRSPEAYQEVMQQRQSARQKLRKLEEIEGVE